MGHHLLHLLLQIFHLHFYIGFTMLLMMRMARLVASRPFILIMRSIIFMTRIILTMGMMGSMYEKDKIFVTGKVRLMPMMRSIMILFVLINCMMTAMNRA